MANDLFSLLATDFPDNTAGAITPAVIRSYFTSMILSMGDGARFTVSGVQLHTASNDSTVAILIPANISRFTVDKFYIENLSLGVSTNSALIGLYTQTGGAGSTISTAAGCTLLSTVNDAIGNIQSIPVSNIIASSDPNIYVRTTTPSSIALTCDVVIIVRPLT